MPAFQPYWGKPAVRNDRGDGGNVGIIRSPLRATVLPDCGGRSAMVVPTATLSRPLLLLGDARTLLRKRKLCPNNLCHLRGSPHIQGPTGVQNSAILRVFRVSHCYKGNRING